VLPSWGGPEDWALYNLKEDRSELKDLSGQHPEKAEEMRPAFESWADSVGVMPWPKVNEIRKTEKLCREELLSSRPPPVQRHFPWVGLRLRLKATTGLWAPTTAYTWL
jgi:hypothetical protein